MPRSSAPRTVAAVDLGSNSFHMVVAQAVGGELRLVDRLRERVALAEGLVRGKRLSAAARRRALACLQRFGQRLRGVPPGSVRAVGTNTLRQLSDTDEFLVEAAAALGHPVEVISGQEEARLIYLGAAHAVGANGKKRLVVDVGGGSTEVIVGKGREPLRADSLYMGCVTWSREHFPDGFVTREGMQAARLAARQELEGIARAYRRAGWTEVLGCSGTVHSVAQILRESGIRGFGITPDALRWLRKEMIFVGDLHRASFPGLDPERSSVLPGGVAILSAVFDSFDIPLMRASPGALREGVVHDLVGRMRRKDVRDATVERMTTDHRVDLAQARRVERTAMDVLAQAEEPWRLTEPRYRKLIGWAARLHEVGLSVAHSGYHRHGAYLVANSHMPGFSREEQRVLAAIVLLHRRKFDVALLGDLSEATAKCVVRLAVIVRLAVLLNRTRSPRRVRPDLEVGKRAITLRFPDGWLARHPLTEADLVDEARRLSAGRIRLEFA